MSFPKTGADIESSGGNGNAAADGHSVGEEVVASHVLGGKTVGAVDGSGIQKIVGELVDDILGQTVAENSGDVGLGILRAFNELR